MISFRPIREFLWLILLPATLLWAALLQLRRRFYFSVGLGYRSRLLTICIGNLHAGGTGKTPLVAWLAKELRPWSPVLVSRGYGGTASKQGAWVDPHEKDGWKKFGDEPIFLARSTGCPVRVGANRRVSAKEIEKKYRSGVLLMDDGFQNLQLKHDLDILVFPETGSWWESFCHPLGPLRESAAALRWADAAILISSGKPKQQSEPAFRWKSFLAEFFPKLPVFEVRPIWGGLYQQGSAYAVKGNERFGAFCGIARPNRFFEALHAHLPPGALRVNHPFSDHHVYSDEDIRRLQDEGQGVAITHWITTEKDLIRLPEERFGEAVLTARVEYDIPEGLVGFIQKRLEKT